MQDLRKNCELVEVEYQNENKKVVMTFLDIENGEVLEVVFNKQVWDRDKKEFVDDKEKEKEVKEWCKEYFNTTFDRLTDKTGELKDVYHYEKFNSLWEVMVVEKFGVESVGEVMTAKITDVKDNGFKIQIFLEIEGKIYVSSMTYSKWIDARKEYLVDPVKKKNQFEKFEKKFGVPVAKSGELVGKEVMIEPKIAFGQFVYIEIKKPNWRGK